MQDPQKQIYGCPGDSARKRGLLVSLAPLFTLAFLFGVVFGWMGGLLYAHDWVIWCVLALCAGGCFVYRKYWPTTVRAYTKGARGEEAVAAELNRIDGITHLYHGIQLANHEDIDHIALGPKGFYLIETKNWSGNIDLFDNQITINGQRPRRDPIAQLRAMSQALSQTFPNLPKVKPILCFVGQLMPQQIEIDEITLLSHDQLQSWFESQPEILTPTQIAPIAHTLSKVKVEEL